MAYLSRQQLRDLWIQNFQPQEINYDDVWESFEKATRIATLTASGETSLVIRYQSDTAPVLSKEANGEYLLILAADTGAVSLKWLGVSGTETAQGSVKLKVRDLAGGFRHVQCGVYSNLTGDEFGALQSVTKNATEPVAGDTVLEIKNINNVAGNWRVVGTIV